MNPFERNNVERQALIGIPFLAAISLATAIAGYGVAHQTGIVQDVIEAANETMHYFDGIIYIHYGLLKKFYFNKIWNHHLKQTKVFI